MGALDWIARRFPPELSHSMAIQALKRDIVPHGVRVHDSRLVSQYLGMEFSSPVGLAAGFDKNAECINNLSRQGFGFVEVGTVTIKPQIGNPKPRVFRYPAHKALVNRLGFPNHGLKKFKENVLSSDKECILGINIGMNKNSDLSDYSVLFKELESIADYITINVSSPNTPGLRDLQNKATLSELLSGVETKKVFVKVAPDLNDEQKQDIAEVAIEHNIAGIIACNTTVQRNEIGTFARGGLSGDPVRDISLGTVRDFYSLVKGKMIIIGCGGIISSDDAIDYIKSGANLVQLYTGLIYHGFNLVNQINRCIIEELKSCNVGSVVDMVGCC